MALDFPSSPTNGQVFGDYTYDSTAGGWRSSKLEATGVPAGGTANQLLSKVTSTDYDTQWITALPIANGGTGLTTGSGLAIVIPTSATTGTVGATGTVTWTSQTSISVNGCFTSAYTRYRIFVDYNTASMTGTDATWVLRNAGTNVTASNYNYSGRRHINWAASDNFAIGQPGWLFMNANTQSGTYTQSYIDIMYPQQSSRTFMNQASNLYGPSYYGGLFNVGSYNATTSVDGFTITFSASSTGTIKIYGYN
jgi:hypothetical protein